MFVRASSIHHTDDRIECGRLIYVLSVHTQSIPYIQNSIMSPKPTTQKSNNNIPYNIDRSVPLADKLMCKIVIIRMLYSS